MFETLDAVKWGKLTHAYGTAEDIPGLLRKLTSKSPGIRDKSLWELYGNLWHQGTIYEATSFAVPFLLELLQSPQVIRKEDLLTYLAALARGNSYIEVHRDLLEHHDARQLDRELKRERRWVEATRKAVRKGLPCYRQLLAEGEPLVRASAAHLLCHFPEASKTVMSALRERLGTETDVRVRAALLMALSALEPEDTETRTLLKGRLQGDRDTLVRAAAAMGLARSLQSKTPPEVVEALTATIRKPGVAGKRFQELPWVDGDLPTYCAAALTWIGKPAEQTLSTLIASLRKMDDWSTLTTLEFILSIAFHYKPRPRHLSGDKLSAAQRMALEGIVRNRRVWGQDPKVQNVSLTELLRSFDLPVTRHNLRRYLAGKLSPRDPSWDSDED